MEDGGHFVGIPLFRFTVEGRRKVVIALLAIVLFVVLGCRRAWNAEHVEIPLRVWVVTDVVGRGKVVVGVIDGRPAWHGVETPMDEDAEFGSGIPLRKRMLIERLEGG